jgi:hypothetical protein
MSASPVFDRLLLAALDNPCFEHTAAHCAALTPD